MVYIPLHVRVRSILVEFVYKKIPMEYTMGASHSVDVSDTKIEDAIEDPPPEVEETEEEAQLRINEEEMNWFWPFI